MAIGIILGAAFGKIVTSLVNDIIMPPIGKLLGNINFSNIFINLSGVAYKTLAEAKAAGAATINVGLFLNTIIDFVIVAFAIFMVIKQLNKLKRKAEKSAAEPTTKACSYCAMEISIKAKRCPHCTSSLEAA